MPCNVYTIHLSNLGAYLKVDSSLPDRIDKFTKYIARCCVFVFVSACTGPLVGLLIYSGFHVVGIYNNILISLLVELYFVGILVTYLGGLVIGIINMIMFYQFVLVMFGLQSV